MSGGTAGTRRPVRGAALAVLSTLLTAVGHVAGGGTVPDLALLVVLFPLLAAVFMSVAERGRSIIGTVTTLAAGQLVLHQLMVLLHPGQLPMGPATVSGMGMFGMHAAVTAVLTAVLVYADAASAGLVAAVRRVVPRHLRPLPADRPLPARPVPGPAVPARLARALSVTHVRRGPPVGCAAAPSPNPHRRHPCPRPPAGPRCVPAPSPR
ncbi:hypothetical protein ACQPZQ_00350 [Pseudonocardia sp. CA-142604]|uniref:hypothetical protein n=1 Tax=Pseudonocardia sp. CA-142604 TaxID=3240024 RepID=UPI003D949C4F